MNDDFYHAHKDGVVTKEEIERFNPDNIDCAAFWREITANDDYRPFCPMAKSKEEVNYYNGMLLIQTGIYNIASQPFPDGLKIIDIGSGFQSAKPFMDRIFPNNIYYPLDIVKYTDDTIVIENCKLPFTEGEIDVVISSNVFQHLGVKQIHKYIKEIGRVLKPRGLSYLGFGSRSGLRMTKLINESGIHCSILGEQVIPFPDNGYVCHLMYSEKMFCLQTTTRFDGYTGQWFVKDEEKI